MSHQNVTVRTNLYSPPAIVVKPRRACNLLIWLPEHRLRNKARIVKTRDSVEMFAGRAVVAAVVQERSIHPLCVCVLISARRANASACEKTVCVCVNIDRIWQIAALCWLTDGTCDMRQSTTKRQRVKRVLLFMNSARIPHVVVHSTCGR